MMGEGAGVLLLEELEHAKVYSSFVLVAVPCFHVYYFSQMKLYLQAFCSFLRWKNSQNLCILNL